MLEGQAQFVWHFHHTGDTEDYLCTFGFDPEFGDPDVGTDLAELGFGNWEAWLIARQSSSIQLIACDVEVQGPTGKNVWTSVGSAVGALAPDIGLSNAAGLVRKITAAAGRGKNGRMYVPGIPVTKFDDVGFIDGAEVTAWNEALAGFLDGMISVCGVVPVVNHSTTGVVTGSPEVTALVMDPLMATQRRRLRR